MCRAKYRTSCKAMLLSCTRYGIARGCPSRRPCLSSSIRPFVIGIEVQDAGLPGLCTILQQILAASFAYFDNNLNTGLVLPELEDPNQ